MANLYLSLAVDPNDATGRFMRGCDEDGIPTNAVHEDAGPTFDVIEVNIAILGDEIDDIMLTTNLKL